MVPRPALLLAAATAWVIPVEVRPRCGALTRMNTLRSSAAGGRPHFLEAPALPPDADLAGPPVDVLQGQPRDLAGTQAQPDQHRQDRQVAAPIHGAGVAAGEQGTGLPRLQETRQARQPPAGDR